MPCPTQLDPKQASSRAGSSSTPSTSRRKRGHGMPCPYSGKECHGGTGAPSFDPFIVGRCTKGLSVRRRPGPPWDRGDDDRCPCGKLLALHPPLRATEALALALFGAFVAAPVARLEPDLCHADLLKCCGSSRRPPPCAGGNAIHAVPDRFTVRAMAIQPDRATSLMP